jgi:DNA-binding protein HU-beta
MPAAKKPAAGKARRTTHRSKSGKKLYAVRDSKGRFKDIQTYERAHRADLKKKAKREKPAPAPAAPAAPEAAPETPAA